MLLQVDVPDQLLKDLNWRVDSSRHSRIITLSYLDESGQVQRARADSYAMSVAAVPTIYVWSDPEYDCWPVASFDFDKLLEIEVESQHDQWHTPEENPIHTRWIRDHEGNLVRLDCNRNIECADQPEGMADLMVGVVGRDKEKVGGD